jgi:hypothetical protein
MARPSSRRSGCSKGKRGHPALGSLAFEDRGEKAVRIVAGRR